MAAANPEIKNKKGPRGLMVYHKTEFKERRNHYAFYHMNDDIDGFDTDRESFIGLYNEYANPKVVVDGKPTNSEAHGWSPIASHYKEITLQPGESKDVIFIVGYIENAKIPVPGTDDREKK